MTFLSVCLDLGMDDDEEEAVPLPNVNAAILKKVIQWCTYHKDDPPPPEDDENKEKRTDDICSWDAEFLKVDQGTLFELILVSWVNHQDGFRWNLFFKAGLLDFSSAQMTGLHLCWRIEEEEEERLSVKKKKNLNFWTQMSYLNWFPPILQFLFLGLVVRFCDVSSRFLLCWDTVFCFVLFVFVDVVLYSFQL